MTTAPSHRRRRYWHHTLIKEAWLKFPSRHSCARIILFWVFASIKLGKVSPLDSRDESRTQNPSLNRWAVPRPLARWFNFQKKHPARRSWPSRLPHTSHFIIPLTWRVLGRESFQSMLFFLDVFICVPSIARSLVVVWAWRTFSCDGRCTLPLQFVWNRLI